MKSNSPNYFDSVSTPLHNVGLGSPDREASSMNKIIEYRAQEQMCRQRAVFDQQHKHYWLGQADMWCHKAEDEISSGLMARGGSIAAAATNPSRGVGTTKALV